MNEKCSGLKIDTSGVPQGSVLGPILFIIYANDIPDSPQNVCKMFADDTNIYTAVDKRGDYENLQQIYLNLVNGVKFGYWSFQFRNVSWYNMEMQNMILSTSLKTEMEIRKPCLKYTADGSWHMVSK